MPLKLLFITISMFVLRSVVSVMWRAMYCGTHDDKLQRSCHLPAPGKNYKNSRLSKVKLPRYYHAGGKR